MQKVAWPITMARTPNGTPNVSIADRSAIAVTIPGSAIGSTSRNDTAVAAEEPEAMYRERGGAP